MSDNIYSYIEENFNIKITDYQFKRDYIKNPLKLSKNFKKTEQPYKEDLEYLYITLNLTLNDLSKLFQVSFRTTRKYPLRYNIKKKKDKILENTIKSINKIYHTNIINIKQLEISKINDKKSRLERYGNENYNNIEKMKQTCLEKYGVQYYTQTTEYKKYMKNIKIIENQKNKEYLTKMKNNSFNISHVEEEIYILLCQKYKEVKRQYKSEKYPFACDFYIPEIDTYIEYQGWWGHGSEPFDNTNINHIEIIKNWNKKSFEVNYQGKLKKMYNYAIKTWTIKDPNKRDIAKKNNLKWLEFFNINQFKEWLKTIS